LNPCGVPFTPKLTPTQTKEDKEKDYSKQVSPLVTKSRAVLAPASSFYIFQSYSVH
jgi:hypothetical protein